MGLVGGDTVHPCYGAACPVRSMDTVLDRNKMVETVMNCRGGDIKFYAHLRSAAM